MITRRFRIFAATMTLAAIPAVALAQQGWGQITLDNRMSATADLYVDGAYGCRALSGLMCTTQVRVGSHNLEARATDRRTRTENGFTVAQGESKTWTVNN
jgi:hypothetical protein